MTSLQSCFVLTHFLGHFYYPEKIKLGSYTLYLGWNPLRKYTPILEEKGTLQPRKGLLRRKQWSISGRRLGSRIHSGIQSHHPEDARGSLFPSGFMSLMPARPLRCDPQSPSLGRWNQISNWEGREMKGRGKEEGNFGCFFKDFWVVHNVDLFTV